MVRLMKIWSDESTFEMTFLYQYYCDIDLEETQVNWASLHDFQLVRELEKEREKMSLSSVVYYPWSQLSSHSSGHLSLALYQNPFLLWLSSSSPDLVKSGALCTDVLNQVLRGFHGVFCGLVTSSHGDRLASPGLLEVSFCWYGIELPHYH